MVAKDQSLTPGVYSLRKKVIVKVIVGFRSRPAPRRLECVYEFVVTGHFDAPRRTIFGSLWARAGVMIFIYTTIGADSTRLVRISVKTSFNVPGGKWSPEAIHR